MTERGLHDKVVDEPLLARVLAVTEENLPVATKDRTTDAMFALVHFDCFQGRDNTTVTICCIEFSIVVPTYLFLLSSFDHCTGNNHKLTHNIKRKIKTICQFPRRLWAVKFKDGPR